jgi:serine/threonine protein kinase/tetratricopeptide (TPR) repeat protein
MTDAALSLAVNDVIDGFTVVRVLGSEHASRTFLVRRSIGAEVVVLKYCRPQSLEAAVLQQVSHPGVCQLLGQGGEPNSAYLLLSNYGQRTLRTCVEQGIAVKVLRDFVLQIAAALEALHAHGFAHGDLRPEHVLIAPNQQAVLIDLHCAYRLDSKPQAADYDGGSLAYLSPERIRGVILGENLSPSSASDYYSLGVIIFQMLSGHLPFSDDTPELLIQSHLNDSTPRLPSHLQAFQPLVDGLMRKDVEQRIASPSEIRKLLDAVNDDSELARRVIRDSAINTQELSSLFADLRLRPDELAKRDKRLRRKRQRRIALQSSVAIILSGLVLAGLFSFREELLPVVEEAAASIGIIENPELTAAWREAQSLASDPNQGLGTIVAAYRRVIDIAPTFPQAAEALDATKGAWKQSISQAMTDNDLERAQARLQEAEAVFGADPELTVLSLRLQNRFRAERLLISTQSLLRSSGLSDEASAAAAVQAFEEILRISPDHSAAAAGLTEISKHYGQLAAEAAQEGEVAEAIRLLQRATAARSDLREHDRVRFLISQATSIQSAVADLLVRAESQIANGRLMAQGDDSAAQLLLQVLATDPDNERATQGLQQITATVMVQTQQMLNQGEIGSAQAMLDLAETEGLNATPIASMREVIDSEITRQRQIAVGLEQASVLFDQGFITAPEPNNAVALLRDVLRLDPSNEQADRQLRQCANRLAEVALQAREVDMFDQAREYLALALAIRPDVEQWKRWQNEW